MAELLLVNPRRRRRKSRKARSRRRRSAPLFATNPRRRKRRSRRANPRRRRMSAIGRRRRNPINLRVSRTDVTKAIGAAIATAAGALVLDVAYGYLPLPPSLKTGNIQWVMKGAAAIGAGVLARNVVSRRTADMITLGALTVIAYGLGRSLIQKNFPAVPLGYYSPAMIAYEPGQVGGGELDASALGAYMTGPAASFPIGGGGACAPILPKSPGLKGFSDDDEHFDFQ